MTGVNNVFAQETHEISSNVPELSNFHKIIFPMWHKAYPAKDIATLKGFVPEIKANMEKINSAKLPDVLRERAANWKTELVKFNAVADNYYKACEENNDEAILNAAEKFHRAYEMMNRVIKPFTKEIDEYHVTLYTIYHKMYPAKNFTEVAGVMDKMIAQADTIAKYPQDKLTRRLKDKTPKYYEVSKELYDATVALKEVLKANDTKKSSAAIEKVHSVYQKLESVFE